MTILAPVLLAAPVLLQALIHRERKPEAIGRHRAVHRCGCTALIEDVGEIAEGYARRELQHT